MNTRRNLTRGEEKFAKSIFGGSINYRNVRVIGGRALKNVAITPLGDMYFPFDDYKTDFVGSNMYLPVPVPAVAPAQPATPQANIHDAHWFLHEFVHVWQHYVGMRVILLAAQAHLKGKGAFSAIYGYSLAANTDLLDYNIEQQGDIIADYYASTYWNRPLTQPVALYADVLANFFDDPTYPIDEKFGRRLRARIRNWER